MSSRSADPVQRLDRACVLSYILGRSVASDSSAISGIATLSTSCGLLALTVFLSHVVQLREISMYKGSSKMAGEVHATSR